MTDTWRVWPDDREDAPGRATEVDSWWLEVFPTEDQATLQDWIWQAAHDHPAGPYLTSREVLHEGYADSLEEAQAKAIKAMQDQEWAWSQMQDAPDWRSEARERKQ